ncbi:hypothetical protein Celal_0261 [Cellulophaga algicola DSM 14237]|uniref:Uncharacterized protein n=1 Tax=Cellulophaga algicola (strain DSM 14237 / IC166 / ACAM 630) TaxID=688270 RepID=E6X8M0_CELAD|nr:leucine-rich repeat domain-containing protein [Cellulophaga algicola]ADV47607.1 hypothetical protein Celal_0261 [Cellulophaga algicola DSM 14237]
MGELILDLVNEDYSFKEFDDAIGIVKYLGESTDIVIPDHINDKPVLYIFREAFWKKGIKAVSLPKLLEHIDEDVFYDNEIKEIIIPSNVKKILGGAFGRNKIEKLEIKGQVATIHMFAFVGNALTTLDLPKSVFWLSNDCFAENDFEELTIPEHITELTSDAFAKNKKLRKVSYPKHLESKIKSAFNGCDMENITFQAY